MLDNDRKEYERIVYIGCGLLIAAVAAVVYVISLLAKWA
jgi:hypothetical protein